MNKRANERMHDSIALPWLPSFFERSFLVLVDAIVHISLRTAMAVRLRSLRVLEMRVTCRSCWGLCAWNSGGSRRVLLCSMLACPPLYATGFALVFLLTRLCASILRNMHRIQMK